MASAPIINRDEYYSVKELSEIFGIHRDTLWYNIRRGKLPHRKVFGRYQILGKDALLAIGSHERWLPEDSSD